MLFRSSELNLDVEEIADIIFVTENGVVINLHQDFVQKKTHRQCFFICEKGTVVCDLIENSVKIYTKNGIQNYYEDISWDKNNMYLFMLKDFFNKVEESNIDYSVVRDSVQVVTLVDLIKEKAVWLGRV